MPAQQFRDDVAERLKTYVYRLIDPRNGETFYVGKGKGNRVFSHARGVLEHPEPSEKIRRIREIQLAGFEVAHVIHRHGMNDATAFEVEAALMDAYAGITNIAGGIGSASFGAMHADEIIRRYSAAPAMFTHRVLLISVNRTAMESSLYEATRYAWKLSRAKAERVQIVLATMQGMIVGAFTPTRWLEASKANFPDREPLPGRYAFEGTASPPELAKLYVRRRVPDEYRRRGAANPVRYAGIDT